MGGDEELANVLKPIVFGQVRNIAPRLINKSLLIYQFTFTSAGAKVLFQKPKGIVPMCRHATPRSAQA